MFQPLRLRSLFIMGASVAAMSAATQAAAQDAFTIEELVVTAEKREQSLQDVPVAVTAYTSEKRDLWASPPSRTWPASRRAWPTPTTTVSRSAVSVV